MTKTTRSPWPRLGALFFALAPGCIPTNPPEAEPPEIEEVSGAELPEYRDGRPSDIEEGQDEDDALVLDEGVGAAGDVTEDEFDSAARFLEG